MSNRIKPEVLAPAGDFERLQAAVKYGADAVYLGATSFGMRANAGNFNEEELRAGVQYAHEHGVRVYLTCNILPTNEEADQLEEFLLRAADAGVDALIVADVGILMMAHRLVPQIDIHISTQTGVVNYLTANELYKLGAKRVVLARELSLETIREIRQRTPADLEIECFVHGAMCMSYSGRCLISNFLADRSANQGKCAHCCRWHYKLHLRLKDGTIKDLEITPENKDMFEYLVKEDFRPDELYEIVEDEHGAYIMNSKDLCLMPKLNHILDIGMHSLKIEGRNKTEYYAAITARSYRQAIDAYYKNPENWSPDVYMKELYTLQNRGYCLGFYDGHLTNLSQNYEYTRTLGDWLFAGSIVEWQGDDIIFELRNYIESGEFIEFLLPNSLENVRLTLQEFQDAETGEITAKVSAGQGKKIRIPASAFGMSADKVKEMLPQYCIARKPAKLKESDQTMLDHKKNEFDILCQK